MIRGWRNNPAWVEFYKRRDEERVDRAIRRLSVENDLAVMQANREMDDEISRIKRTYSSYWPYGIGFFDRPWSL